MNNAVFEKAVGNVIKIRDIELVTTETRWNYLVSEPSIQHIFFPENFLAIELKIHVKPKYR